MEIRNFLTFKEIVETGSFSGAAKNLHYAQSTVSSHIQSLEESMGVLLFDRIGNKTILTEKGKKLYNTVLELLDTYEKIKAIPSDGDEISGELNLVIPDSLMLYKLAYVVKEYQELYPNIKIIHSGDCVDIDNKVAKGEVDIGFNIGIMPKHPELVCETLTEIDFGLVYSPSIEKLDKDSYYTFLFLEEKCCFRIVFDKYVREKEIKSKNQIETQNVEIIKQYIQRGLGISVLPHYVIQEELKVGKLKRIPIETEENYIAYMLYNKNKTISPAMSKFIELVNTKIINKN